MLEMALLRDVMSVGEGVAGRLNGSRSISRDSDTSRDWDKIGESRGHD